MANLNLKFTEVKKLKKIPTKVNMKNLSEFVLNDEKKISWAASLKMSAIRHEELEFDKSNIVLTTYRPFTKKYLYRARILNERPRKSFKTFPNKYSSNLFINISGAGTKNPFSSLLTDTLMDMNGIYPARNLPRYIYENDGLLNGRFDNIINDDEYYYVYGLLHTSEYRKKYSNDLQKALPRIPTVKYKEKYIDIGYKLADLHLNYENQPNWNGVETVLNSSNLNYKVTKMKHPKKGGLDTILYNEHITIKNIPKKAYEYVVNGRPAIEWIIDQYRVKTDKKSGITDNPNEFSDDPKYILNLLLSVITVSMKTLELIEELPKFEVID